jgi:uncharacterized membrane protein
MYLEAVRARKSSCARRGFLIHLAVYVAVNTLLVGINLATTPDTLWFPWPLAGWGVGLLAHAGIVLARRPASRSTT